MGNVNGKEDEDGSPSAAEEDSGAAGSLQEGPTYGVCLVDGSIPPHSPRATHSPLMFTPQVPVVSLQRPDEIQIPNSLWMQTSGFENMCWEQGIPTMITWSYGGKDVVVEGSWDNWKTRLALQRSGKDFTIMKVASVFSREL
ncbi:hypothetical protein FF1_019044 [Malus domestica]